MSFRTNQGLRAGSAFVALIRLAILGAVITGIVLALQRPDLPERPPASTDLNEDLLVSQLSQARAEKGVSHEIPWTSINGILADRMKQASLEGPQFLPIELVGCYVSPAGDVCEVVMERRVWNHSIFTAATVAPKKSPDGYTIEVQGGRIGRLPLPNATVLYLDQALRHLPIPFASELDILRNAESIKITPESLEAIF